MPAPPPVAKAGPCVDAAEEIARRRGHFPGWGEDAIRDRKDPDDWVSRARRRQWEGDFEGAIADCTKAIELDPKNVEAWSERAEARRSIDDYSGEVSDFTRVVELSPGNSVAWSNRGLARTDAGDNEGALSDCDKALELDPASVAAWVYRAIIHVKRREFEAALSDCNKAIEVDPNERAGWYWRGLVRHLSGDSSAALEDFEKALDRVGAASSEYVLLARWVARLRMGHKVPSGQDQGATFRFQPQSERDVWVHALLSFSHGRMTREDLIARAEAASRVDRRGRTCEAYFYAGTAALSEGREAQAIQDFEKSVATGLVSYTEYDLAQCELERLKKAR